MENILKALQYFSNKTSERMLPSISMIVWSHQNQKISFLKATLVLKVLPILPFIEENTKIKREEIRL